MLAKVQQPSKRWRNIWRVADGINLYVDRHNVPASYIIDAFRFYSAIIYPSYEIAETKGRAAEEKYGNCTWLDAVPVDGDK